MVHGADDERDVGGSVVGAEADVAFIDGSVEFLTNAVSHQRSFSSI